MRGDSEREGMSEMMMGGRVLVLCLLVSSPHGWRAGTLSRNHLRGEVENVGESLVARRSQSRREGRGFSAQMYNWTKIFLSNMSE